MEPFSIGSYGNDGCDMDTRCQGGKGGCSVLLKNIFFLFLLFEPLNHGLRLQLFFERKLVCNTANKNPILIDRLIF